MRRPAVSLWVVCGVLGVLSCGQQASVGGVPGGDDADVKAVSNLIEAWFEYANSNDGDGLIGLTCPDLEVIPPAGPPVVGTEAREMFLGFFDSFTVSIQPTTTEVVACGEWAFRRYAYEMTLAPKEGGEPLTERGFGVQMFRRQGDGAWCLAKDIWNSVTPEPEPS
jgi:ketosteroid isomerase-like protein